MTGHQLKTMLMIEGSLYTLSAILVTFALNLIFSPLLEHGMNQIFWFFSYHFTVTPILIMFPHLPAARRTHPARPPITQD